MSFSTSCFPTNPVAPVINIDFRLKYSAIILASVLADMIFISEYLKDQKKNKVITMIFV